MTFFSRPNLSEEQFKQLPESVLSLSGQTQIHSTTGLTIANGSGGTIIINAKNAVAGSVMTYDGHEISLKPSTSGGSTGMYYGKSPAAICVGGIAVNYKLTGKTISCIIQDMLVPTLYPTLTNPSSSFSINPAIGMYEIGGVVNPQGNISFNQGCINPKYSSASDKRSNGSLVHIYQDFNGVIINCNCISSNGTYQFPTYSVVSGVRTAYGSVSYSGGEQPKDSSGNTYCAPLVAGTTTPAGVTICGIYPWFWGKSTTAPIINQALINGNTCKCVGNSCGTITVDNFNVVGKYIWFAIPSTSTSKSSWQGANNPSNNGVIPGGLFPVGQTFLTDSPQVCWNDVNYKVYVSNYATDVNYGMTFSN